MTQAKNTICLWYDGDGIVPNIYANNPGKLAAWLSASHVEKASKKKDPPTP